MNPLIALLAIKSKLVHPLINKQMSDEFEFYVVMNRRKGERAPDLHKTDGVIYYTPEDAQAAIDKDPLLAPYRRVVKMLARLAEPDIN